MASADIDGLMLDCSNSSALAVELLQSCTTPYVLSEYSGNRRNKMFPVVSIRNPSKHFFRRRFFIFSNVQLLELF